MRQEFEKSGQVMRGRKPSINWQRSKGEYTTTIGGQFYRLGTDSAQAQVRFEFLLRKHDLGEQGDGNPTFAEVADRWLLYVEENHDPNRYRHCKSRLEEFVDFIGPTLRVNDLRPWHVEQWLEGKPEAKKPGTLRNYKAIILAALNWAAGKRKGKLIPSNPLRGLLELPECGSRGEDVLWPKSVFDLVMKVANPAFADVVRVLAWTGARPSTICKIEKRHYRKQWRLWDVEDLYRGRKSRRKYVRRVRLLPQAVPLVERLNSEYPEGPIFRNSDGGPWSPETLGVYMYQLRHKFKETRGLGWPGGLCLYGLRHTFATAFLADHPNEIEYLRILLGHKDYTMILAHYGHLIDQHEKINNKLDGFDPFAA
jgi:integrase